MTIGACNREQTDIIFRRWGLVLALVMFVIFSLPRVVQPLTQDEVNYFWAAKSWLATGQAWHYDGQGVVNSSPYLYLLGTSFFLKLFGYAESAARLFGVVAMGLTIALAYRVVRKISQDASKAAFAALLIAVTPAFSQGAAILDVDCTILPALVLFAVWAFLLWLEKPVCKNGFFLALAVGLLLWGRVTTPWLLILAMGVWPVVIPMKERAARSAWIWLVFGVGIFVVSWYLFCAYFHVRWEDPFLYTWSEIVYRVPKSGRFLSSLGGSEILAMGLWFGPLWLLWAAACWLRWRESRLNPGWHHVDLMLILGVVWMAASTAAGVNFGFPKYHIPAAIMLTMAAGVVCCRSTKLMNADVVGLTAAAGLAQFFVFGDTLFMLRYQSRAWSLDAAFGPIPGQAWAVGLAGAICVFLLLAWFLTRRMELRILGIIGLTAGMNLGLSLVQVQAPYDTGYNYGGRGTREAGHLIALHAPAGGRVVASDEILFYAGRPGSETLANSTWSDHAWLVKTLSDQKTSALALSLVSNSVRQVREIGRDPVIMNILSRDFLRHRVGVYDIWLRKAHE